jgi:dienelactone hydrolase
LAPTRGQRSGSGLRLFSFCLVALVATSATGCSGRPPDPPPGARKIAIPTAGGERLAGVELGSGGDLAVLSHGATGTKEDFYELAGAFAADGWRVIAYDARGAGQAGGSMTEASRREDLRAVVEYADPPAVRSLLLAGGSIGASLSLAMARKLDAAAVVSLSAPSAAFGALEAAQALRGTPVFVAAAEDNEPFASDARAIARALRASPTIVGGDGHGTGMLDDHPELIDEIIAFADRATGHDAGAGGGPSATESHASS